MNFEIQRILEGKQAFRRRLAARPIAEKLRLLDDLRERALAIAASRKRATLSKQ
jgi:hypothetical protein